MNPKRVDQILGEEVTDEYMLNQWYPAARFDDLKENEIRHEMILGKSIVLWRSGEKVYARRNFCPHQQSSFYVPGNGHKARVDGPYITCPYHGWQYGDDGRSVNYPSNPGKKPVKGWRIEVYSAQIKYGWVWVCLGENPHDIPEFPQWEDDSYNKVWCGPYDAETSWARSVLNAADVSHFPFVHEGSLGNQENTVIPDFEVTWDKDSGICAKNVMVWQDNPDGKGIAGYASYSYFIPKPHVLRFVKKLGAGDFAIFFAIRPYNEESCQWWLWMAMNYDVPDPEAIRKFQDDVSAEDLALLAAGNVKKLSPLEDGYPLIPADYTTIAFLQWLKALGVTFGLL